MKKRITFLILLTSLVVLGGILSKKENEKQLDNLENIKLAIYVNNEKTKTIPTKGENIFDEAKSSCTNDAYIIWDYESWSPIVKNVTTSLTKCNLYFKKGYSETILNGTDPVIKDELIPVTIDSDGTVKKADIGSEWYSYEKKNWANAIILKDETEDYLAGEVIPEDKIESYFVWIPKYRYQLWDLGQYNSLTAIDTSKVHEIPIIFGNYNTSDDKENECTTPMESGETGNCQVGNYMTHPAFLSIPSTGFWASKFSAGYDGAKSVEEAQSNKRDASKVIVKPNVYSWRNIQLTNAFYTSYDYKRDLDSHMMKNTEWGAVAYLQHSAYGSAISLRINNNNDQITGYAANNEPTCGWTATNEECSRYCNDGTCNTAYPNSLLASTTGDITGLFDMAGRAAFVMGVMLDETGNPMSGRNNLYNSGFNGTFSCPTCDNDTSGLTKLTTGNDWPDKRYYDAYDYFATDNQYQKRILGDATGEMGPIEKKYTGYVNHETTSWYNDLISNYNKYTPIASRGYYLNGGYSSGIFAFQGLYGNAASATFRIILTPTKN